MPRKKIRPAVPERPGKFEIKRAESPIEFELGDPEKDAPIWMSRIAKTLATRAASDNGDKHWVAYWSWFAGRQWLYENTGKSDWELYSDTIRSVYTNNIVQSQASAYMPFLLNGEIRFKAKPRRPQDVNAAEIHTSLLNYEWKERSMTEEVKKVVDDVVVIGHGVAEIGYVVEVDEARKKSQGRIDYRDYVKKDAAFVERVDPLDFIFDLSARDGTPKTARWCAKRIWIPLADLIANKRYDKKVVELIYAGGSSHTISMKSSFKDTGKAADALLGKEFMSRVPEDSLVAVWQIWDKKHRKVIEMAEGLPKPLTVEDWPYDYLDGHPFVFIPFLRAAGLLYPIGVARQLKDAQLQINRIRTQQIQNIRAQKNMFGYDTNVIQAKETLEDFADLPALSLIPMNGQNGVFAIPNPPMNRDSLIVEQAIGADAQRVTGADALFQGQPLQDRATAGEASIRANILRLKADDKITNVERGVEDIARQVLQHLKANRVEDNVTEIVGLLGSQWREYTAAEIQAESDVEVSYFAAPKYDPAVERQQRLNVGDLATKMAPVMQQSGATETIDMAQVFAFILDSFDDIKDAGRFFKKALVIPPPLEETQASSAGLPPAVAGSTAPGPLPQEPGAPQPGEGLSQQDLMMALFSGANQGGLQ